MNDGSLHELSAAYALNALDGDDLRAFEAHLAGCQRCREDVVSFRAPTAALAYDVDPLLPPEPLERRILTAARAERRHAAPLRQRWALPAAGLAAAAAAAAIGLGVWATQLSHSLDRERSAHRSDSQMIAILSQGTRIRTSAGSGLLVVAPTRQAVLIANLPPARPGRTYEAWVVVGKHASPAGLFHGGAASRTVLLTEPVAPGSTVGVTVEQAGGSTVPTTAMVLRAEAKGAA
jgi:anti-sigma-K factor RskA